MTTDPTPQPNALASVPPEPYGFKLLNPEWLLNHKLPPFSMAFRIDCPDGSWFCSKYCGHKLGGKLIELYRYATSTTSLPPEAFAPIAQPADAATAQESMDVHLREARAEIERLRNQLKQSDDYIKKMDAVIDDERVANSCINPLEDLKRAVAKLKSDRTTAEKKARELGEALQAARRIVIGKYVDWHHAGGVNDCKHGRGEGIPCLECDKALVIGEALPPTPSQEQAGGAADVSVLQMQCGIPTPPEVIPQPASEWAALLPDYEDTEAWVERCWKAIAEEGRASTSFLQRRFRLGYTRAARFMDIMRDRGWIGPVDGAKPVAILRSIAPAPGTGADTEGEG